jgi:probable addiction module antidote protein
MTNKALNPDDLKIIPWNSEELIKDDEYAIEYLNAVLELNDPDLLATALGNVVRARGVAQTARAAGVDRTNLYRALGGGAAIELGTALRVIAALGIKLTASRAEQAAA